MLSRIPQRRLATRRLNWPSRWRPTPTPTAASLLVRHHSESSSPSSSSSSSSPTASSGLGQTRGRPSLKTQLLHDASHQTNRFLATTISDPVGAHLDGFEPGMSYLQSQLKDPFGNPVGSDASIVILDEKLETQPISLRSTRGIGGQVNEIVANFDVCLGAGMFKRAGQIIDKLKSVYPMGSQEMLDLHNRYLGRIISYMMYHNQTTLVTETENFFDKAVKAGLHVDSISYAWMLKMALRMNQSYRRIRVVNTYWEMAKNAEAEEEVLNVPILSAWDLNMLAEICASDFQPIQSTQTTSAAELEADAQQAKSDQAEFGDDHELEDSQLSQEVLYSLPEVMAVNQKGLGLEAVRNSLSMFDNDSEPLAYPHHLEGTKDYKDHVYAQMRQRKLESDGVAAAIKRWTSERENLKSTGIPLSQRSIGAIMAQWHQDIALEIEAELTVVEEVEKKDIITGADHDHLNLAPYLRIIGSDKLAAVAILATLNGVARIGVEKGVKAGNLVTLIGSSIYEEFACEQLRRNHDVLYGDEKARKKFLKELFQPKNRPFIKQRIQALVSKASNQTNPVDWSPVVEAKIGALLASFVMSCCKIPVEVKNHDTGKTSISMQPAFNRIYAFEKGRRVGKVVLHEKLIQKLQSEPPAPVLAKHLPMVASPRPWEGVYNGGFLDHLSSLTRVKKSDKTQLHYIEAAADRGKLDKIFAGLTVLGKTGWKVNKGVLKVMIEAWNSGEEIACIAPAHPKIDYPEKPDTEDKDILKEYNRKMRLAENLKMSYHSQRCFQNFQIEIARAYRNETFYLPHNLDFRGRAYPLVPYFNQMGPDNCRGLLLFSKGRKLGERGLRWLKIHLANLYGFDKASFNEREQFTMDHMDDVMDSADNGLKGRKWWLEAEDPFQCLAACMEVTNAMRLEDPTQYISHLPVHQDGSCNGLQHYAALGGDIVGAQQVNLAPSDRPSDIYTAVAEYVKKAVKSDLLGKEGSMERTLAQMLDGKITRKVVKQTVMTNVYGVTFLGAIRQVRKQLDDLYPDIKESGSAGQAATYVAKKIFQALGSMFSGAHDIQFWFGDCASRVTSSLSPAQIEDIIARADIPIPKGITKAERTRLEKAKIPEQHFRSPIIWTTPLNLPVVQPYRENKVRIVATNMQNLSIQEPNSSDTVSKRKQLQAFPPNFIHSLDATHMLMSAVKCDELGLSFSAVHDSFWTHAADIDTMNRVLRDAFVQLHSQNLIQRLADEFKTRYGDHLYLAKVKSTSDIGRRIQAWRYEHNLTKVQELELEYRRWKLLRSKDPEKQEEGRAMSTPAALFEADKTSKDQLQAVKSLGVAMIGEQEGTHAQVKKAAESPVDDIPSEDGDIFSALDADLEKDIDEAEAVPAAEEAKEAKPAKSKRKSKQAKDTSSSAGKANNDKLIWLWIPCEFPDVPKKGDFDVSMLKDSEYFFS
ncbi:hypothetical protein KEM56_003769 [Ascosphaera pollenicola]|nr:hypothetical protein KEM56_003769 [Ascosphaera pollenicola]